MELQTKKAQNRPTTVTEKYIYIHTHAHTYTHIPITPNLAYEPYVLER